MNPLIESEVSATLVDMSNGVGAPPPCASIHDFAPLLRRLDDPEVTVVEGGALLRCLRETCQRTGRMDYWRYAKSKPRYRAWFIMMTFQDALGPIVNLIRESDDHSEDVVRRLRQLDDSSLNITVARTVLTMRCVRYSRWLTYAALMLDGPLNMTIYNFCFMRKIIEYQKDAQIVGMLWSSLNDDYKKQMLDDEIISDLIKFSVQCGNVASADLFRQLRVEKLRQQHINEDVIKISSGNDDAPQPIRSSQRAKKPRQNYGTRSTAAEDKNKSSAAKRLLGDGGDDDDDQSSSPLKKKRTDDNPEKAARSKDNASDTDDDASKHQYVKKPSPGEKRFQAVVFHTKSANRLFRINNSKRMSFRAAMRVFNIYMFANSMAYAHSSVVSASIRRAFGKQLEIVPRQGMNICLSKKGAAVIAAEDAGKK